MSKTAEILAEKHECLKNVECGIDIGKGWFDLVDCLTTYLENYRKNENMDPLIVTQIKQKFRGLRYYTGNTDNNDFIRGMITIAESLSYYICEYCGNKANYSGEGLGSTVCNTCKEDNVSFWDE